MVEKDFIVAVREITVRGIWKSLERTGRRRGGQEKRGKERGKREPRGMGKKRGRRRGGHVDQEKESHVDREEGRSRGPGGGEITWTRRRRDHVDQEEGRSRGPGDPREPKGKGSQGNACWKWQGYIEKRNWGREEKSCGWKG